MLLKCGIEERANIGYSGVRAIFEGKFYFS